MAKFNIISKDGESVRFSGCPKYTGTFLGVSFLEFMSIESPTLIEWEIGDYIDYDRTGLRYKLYTLPIPKKQARAGSHGSSFVYSNVKFYAETKDLEIAPFRDLVPEDNNIHFSTRPDVSTYENVYGLARRIQACMDDVFPGKWRIEVYDTDDTKLLETLNETKDFSISNSNCLQTLSQIYEKWDNIGWIHSYDSAQNVHVITIGRASVRDNENTSDVFAYGLGNGLTSIKKTSSNEDEFATRLYIYGSDRNIQTRYYKEFDILNAESVDIRNLMLPISTWGKTDGLPDARKAYLEADQSIIEKYGLIPRTVYFDGSQNEAIYPSIQGLKMSQVREEMIASGEGDSEHLPPALDIRIDRTGSILLEIGNGSKEEVESNRTFVLSMPMVGFNIEEQGLLTSEGMATISIKSGPCAGREFKVKSYWGYTIGLPNGYHSYELYRSWDESLGMGFPNTTYPINEGDEFVLLDIPMPDYYITLAEKRLLEAGQKKLAECTKVSPYYEPAIDPIKIKESGKALREGMYMQISDPDIIDTEDGKDYVLIDTLTIDEKAEIPKYNVTLRKQKKTSKSFAALESRVGASEKSLSTLTSEKAGKSDTYSKANIDNLLKKYLLLEAIKQTVKGDIELEGNLKVKGDIFSTGQFAAATVGAEGGGSVGAAYLADLYDVSLGSLLSGDLLSWNGSEWVNIKQSSLVPDLSAYATKNFVTSQGYIKESVADGRYATIVSLNGVDDRLASVEKYFATSEDADSQINKWNEIVAFLDATEGTTLAGILATYATNDALNAGLAERYTKKEIANLFSTFSGNGNISTLGTIQVGVWNGTPIENRYLKNSKISISGINVALGGSISQASLRTGLGLDDLLAWYDSVGVNFQKHSDGTFYVNGNLVTKGQFAASLVGQEEGGGGVMLLTSWPSASGDYSGYALGGNLGVELNDRVKTLEGKATAVSFSPSLTSGKQIGVLTIDGVANSLYAPSMYDWSEINAKPTKLSDFTDDVVAGKYLPLSGGTINGASNSCPLFITSNTDDIKISLGIYGYEKAEIGWSADLGVYLYNPYYGVALRLDDKGGVYYGETILLHSGNYSDYALPLSGGTMSGRLRLAGAGTAWLSFVDSYGVNTYGIIGVSDDHTPVFHDGTSTKTILHSGNYSDYALPLTGGTISGNLTVDGSTRLLRTVFEFTDEINRYGGDMYLQHRGNIEGSQGSARTGNIRMCYNGGYVSIGHTIPNTALHVRTSSHLGITVESSISIESSIVYKDSSAREWIAGIGVGGVANSFGFWTNTNLMTVMSLQNNGNVLIGTTTNRGYMLDVNGNIGTRYGILGYCEGTYSRWSLSHGSNTLYIQSGYTDGSSTNGTMMLSGVNTYNLEQLDVRANVASFNGSIVTNEITIGGIKLDVSGGALRVNGDIFSTGQFAASVAGEATGGSVLDYASIVNALGYTPADNNNLAQVAFTGSYADLSNKPTSLPASDVYSWAKASVKPTYSWSEIQSRPDVYTKQEIDDKLSEIGGGEGCNCDDSTSGLGDSMYLYELNGVSYDVPNGVNCVMVTEDATLDFNSVIPLDPTRPCIMYLVKTDDYTLQVNFSSKIEAANSNGGLVSQFSVDGYTGMMLVWDTDYYKWWAYIQRM